MAGAQALLPRSGDWTLRPFEATRVAPVWVGIGIAFAYLLLDAVVFNLFGLAVGLHIRGVPFYETLFWWLELLNAAILAYLPTATAYLRRGAARDLRELRPLLRCNDTEFATLLRQTTCAASWQLRARVCWAGCCSQRWSFWTRDSGSESALPPAPRSSSGPSHGAS